MTYRRCKCPVWIFGSVEGRRVRYALDTVSWERGEELVRELDPQEIPVKMTLADACDRYVEHCESRNAGDRVSTPRLKICPNSCSHPVRGNNTVRFLMYGATTCTRLRLSVVGFTGTSGSNVRSVS